MVQRIIILHPDPRLTKSAGEVIHFDEELRVLVDDMFETMYEAPGIGLAAPQIAILKRVLVMDCATPSPNPEEHQEPRPFAMINPQVIWCSEQRSVYEEGCLSIPKEFAEVERPASVTVHWQDVKGEANEKTFAGLEATCVQHEIDHLNGKLFIDYLGPMKRRMITDRMRKRKREQQRASPGVS